MNRLERIARQNLRSIEVPGSGVETYLATISAMAARTKQNFAGYNSLEDFVRRNGRPMTRIGHPEYLMTRGECFRNAAMLALKPLAKVIYCEGFAHTGLIPVLHAWCVTESGMVIDPTWGMDGLEYFGVAIRKDYLRKITAQLKYWGILNQPGKSWPILSAHPKEWRDAIMDRLPLPEAEAWT